MNENQQGHDEAEKSNWKLNIDKEFEQEIARRYISLLGGLSSWYAQTRLQYIDSKSMESTGEDPISEINYVLEGTWRLLTKYNEPEAAAEVAATLKEITGLYNVKTLLMIERLRHHYQQLTYYMGVKHSFKDSTESRPPWDQTLKKKMSLENIPADKFAEFGKTEVEVEAYYSNIKPEWKRLCFRLTSYCTLREGDIHILLGGVNNSGKSNASVMILAYCNELFRTFWHCKKYKPTYVKEHPELADILVDPFSLAHDVHFIPDSSALNKALSEQQYNTWSLDEALKSAMNLRSQSKESIDFAINRFIGRSSHSIVVHSYQVAKRTTSLLAEGMSIWLQKMNVQYFVAMLPPSTIRKGDPFYFRQLDKLTSESEINKWILKNPNYLHTFRSPRMPKETEDEFKGLQEAAHSIEFAEQEAAREAKRRKKELSQGLPLIPLQPSQPPISSVGDRGRVP
jgi:hypothetical protein